ncbi:MAG: ATP-binding cassette domain-containing protein [Actinomycetia bacterium]|nr:ATP-binding cassette domain-containing protein [Actinomycetes bacterium]
MNETHHPRTTRPVVQINSLTKRYGTQMAVDSVSFEVPSGQVIGLLGPNGAGKTTLMKMLVGLVSPSEGTAQLMGTDLDSPEFCHAIRRVGALIESPALYLSLSARQNLELQARALGIRADRGRIEELLELVDLTDRGNDHAGAYSLGMKQRLGIAIAMIGSPELVILDEPANGLDPAGIVEIRKLLRRLPEMGTTVLVSSHQLAEVQQAADSLVVLDHGRLITAGTTEQILEGHTSSDFTVRVDPASVEDAMAVVNGFGLDTSRLNGSGLSIRLPDEWGGRDLNHLLASSGIYADEIIRHTVSLEEAFLAMTHSPSQSQNPTTELEGAVR